MTFNAKSQIESFPKTRERETERKRKRERERDNVGDDVGVDDVQTQKEQLGMLEEHRKGRDGERNDIPGSE